MLKYYGQLIVLGTTYKNEFPFPLRRTIKVRDFRVWGIGGSVCDMSSRERTFVCISQVINLAVMGEVLHHVSGLKSWLN